jgi:hypothetical protein
MPVPETAAAVPITRGATIASKCAPPEPTATGIGPGSAVITDIWEAIFREGPSPDAANIPATPLGAELVLIGPSLPSDDVIWWPLSVVETAQEGYMAEQLLIPVDAE